MSISPKKKDSLEVSSDSIQTELVAIRDRLSAIETIQSLANRPVVQKYVEDSLPNGKGKQVLVECEKPRTRKQLIEHFKFESAAALDYHLKPLRELDLIQMGIDESGTQTFEWSNLFRRLPKATIKHILNSTDNKTSNGKKESKAQRAR
jgi:hypothetical protein